MERLQLTLTALSIGLILLVLFSVRRAHIRVEYSVSWLAASVALFVVSRWPSLLNWLALELGLGEPAVAVMLVVSTVFLVVFYRFSIIISGLKDSNIALTQRLAILEYRISSQHESR
jgi:hypothetical protein